MNDSENPLDERSELMDGEVRGDPGDSASEEAMAHDGPDEDAAPESEGPEGADPESRDASPP